MPEISAAQRGLKAEQIDAVSARAVWALEKVRREAGRPLGAHVRARVDLLIEWLKRLDACAAEVADVIRAAPAATLHHLGQLGAELAEDVDRGLSVLAELEAQFLLLRFATDQLPAARDGEWARLAILMSRVELLIWGGGDTGAP